MWEKYHSPKPNKDYIMPATLPGPEAMEVNPVTLSFSGDLEEAFLEDYYKNSLSLVRFSLLIGIFMYGFFGILDARLVPDMTEKLWTIRFAIVCPVLLGVILFSYSSHFKKYFQMAVSTAMLTAGLAIVAMIYIIPPPVNYSYYAGLILVLIWGYTFTRVRFIWATTAGWIIVAFYEIGAIWGTHTPSPILLSNNFFFIGSNLVGMFSGYYIEHYSRWGFYLAYMLEQEQRKLLAANRTLEKIVQDKTSQLLETNQTLEKIVQERTSQLVETNQNLRMEIEERKTAEARRVELEKQLLQAQKMEAVGTLAGGIAHDFNNLLMGIQGLSSLMLLDTEPATHHYEKLKNIEQYVLKGADLTKQLLGFARGGKYEVRPTDLNELLIKSSQMFGRTKKEISIFTKLDPDLWTVEVDKGQIDQVLLNLYVNAWQAMPGGGSLYLQSKNVILDGNEIQSVKPGKYVQISIADTGVGMDDRTKERIFEPFFTTKEMGRGTGLGLASAYGIIKSHGGVIAVQSAKGQGTTFVIHFPTSERRPEKEKIGIDMLRRGCETILLVDDEEMILNVTVEMLKRLGYKILTAQSGQEALEIFKRHKEAIDLIILDMIMPGMSGSETYNLLKDILPNIKVLLSSGYSISGEATEILNRGCQGFVQKPFTILKLSYKIRDILDKDNFHSQPKLLGFPT
jgi:signal transduction histidine kinase/ActR/RegA family two-component response regulator